MLVYTVPSYTIDNVYIADTNNQRIRKVSASTEIITTIAGTGTASYSGDNGPATSATLNYPYDIVIDSFTGNDIFSVIYFSVICSKF